MYLKSVSISLLNGEGQMDKGYDKKTIQYCSCVGFNFLLLVGGNGYLFGALPLLVVDHYLLPYPYKCRF
jgi:hypothetical protein